MPKGISDGPLCAAAVPRNPNGVSNTANDFVCYRKYGGKSSILAGQNGEGQQKLKKQDEGHITPDSL